MDELKRWYRDGLEQRIAGLERLVARLADGDGEVEAELRTAIDTVRASAASYGFPEVSAPATIAFVAPLGELAGAVTSLTNVLRAVIAAGGREHAPILIVGGEAGLAREFAAHTVREVRVAATAAAAHAVLATEEVALVLLSLVLPDRDGRQLLASLREDTASAHLPILAIAPRVTETTALECRALGAVGVFALPGDRAALLAAVERVLPGAVVDARTDPRTGLGNRASFIEGYAIAVEAAAPGLGAIALFDVGLVDESVAERRLVAIAAALAHRLGTLDTVARWDDRHLVAALAARDVLQAVDLVRAAIAAGARALTVPSDPVLAGVVELDRSENGSSRVIAKALRLLLSARLLGGDAVRVERQGEAMPPLSLLYAEDDPVTARLIGEVLMREGFAATHAADGELALAEARSAPPALVLLDVRMPKKTGFEVLEELRRDARFATTPIVILSSLGSAADVARGFDLGADDYIVKPFEPLALVTRLHLLLARKAQATPSIA